MFINKFRFAKENETTAFRAEANNVGYRDQRYLADLQKIGKVRATFEFNSNPLYQVQARSYFSGAGSNTLTIDDAAQTAIQTSPLNAESALAAYGHNYNIESRRDLATLGMTYTASRDVDVKFTLRNTNRTGTNLQNFGFGNSPGNMLVLDMPVPVNDRTTDLRTKLEWANQRGLLAVGYDASWYGQHNSSFTFDNPQRVADSATGPAPPLIPFDGSPHKTMVTNLDLQAALDYVTVPKIAEEAYLRAKITNTSDSILLPGPANIFHEDEFVGTDLPPKP